MVSKILIRDFKTTLQRYYEPPLKRSMPWRDPDKNGYFDPYKILVSEIMLQQTQVGRVTEYFNRFLSRFPDVSTLAAVDLAEVLVVWKGLGYNRRARFVHQAARSITENFEAVVPNDIDRLISLPGVGKNTAGAVLAYAFNQPTIFIETNVRTIYIHHFFSDEPTVSDKQIEDVLKMTIDLHSPREFYWALMDYGTEFKKEHKNMNSRSKHYVKQKPFKGSLRELRGRILWLVHDQAVSIDSARSQLNDARFDEALKGLSRDNLIEIDQNMLRVQQ